VKRGLPQNQRLGGNREQKGDPPESAGKALLERRGTHSALTKNSTTKDLLGDFKILAPGECRTGTIPGERKGLTGNRRKKGT